MTYALVHIGHGKTVVREVSSPPDLTLDAPRKSQRLSGVAKFLLNRTAMEHRVALETAHTGYRPGKLMQLGHDQCMFCPGSDGIMCGAKVHIGKSSRSYCAEHYAKIYIGKPTK